MLKPNDTITAQRYREQIDHLSRAFKEKHPEYDKRHTKVIFQHDNGRPVKETLELLGWDVLMHPTYSPDLSPSDYHLFRSMQYSLSEQHFTFYENIKN